MESSDLCLLKKYIYLGLKESSGICLLQTVYLSRFEGKLLPMSTKEVYLSRFEGKLRPMSTIDSGLYSTDSTDSDQDPEKTTQGIKLFLSYFT